MRCIKTASAVLVMNLSSPFKSVNALNHSRWGLGAKLTWLLETPPAGFRHWKLLSLYFTTQLFRNICFVLFFFPEGTLNLLHVYKGLWAFCTAEIDPAFLVILQFPFPLTTFSCITFRWLKRGHWGAHFTHRLKYLLVHKCTSCSSICQLDQLEPSLKDLGVGKKVRDMSNKGFVKWHSGE